MKDGPVEAFLAELEHGLRRHEPARRRVVAETGDHLRDLVDEGRERGLEQLDAEREAVERFGSSREFARAMRPKRGQGRLSRIVAVVAAAGVLGGLAFGALRDEPPSIGVPQVYNSATGGAGNALGCISELRERDRPAPGYASPANRVTIDPRTGRVVKCEPMAISFVASDPRYETVVTRKVTYEVALHQ